MVVSFIYVLLAILGISFLIFIHELGHYLMARRVGMRVETFSIGFGRPIYSWMHDGVKWQIGWLLFGGYVKIAGAELDKDQNPYEIADGFFGKSPLDRIKVAFMGPLANLIFAFLAFTALWIGGGRQKNFSEFTKVIGWVDPASELYANGIRPGDEITAYDDEPFQGSRDHLYAPMRGGERIHIKGLKVNYSSGEKSPYDIDVKLYQHPAALEKGILTAGILQPASYIFYDKHPDGSENPLPEGSPLQGSGLEYGDRIVWVGGEEIFSLPQLNNLLSGKNALLTIQRGSKTLLARVPRVQFQELRTDNAFKEEISDWQFEARLNNFKMQNLYIIPYNLNNDSVVEGALRFIDKDQQAEAFPAHPYSDIENPLQSGDKIIAINGIPIQHASQLLSELQKYRVNVIVQRENLNTHEESWRNEDQNFAKEVEWNDIKNITETLGTKSPVTHFGSFYLLNPITPKPRSEFALTPETQAQMNAEIAQQRKAIESIDDAERKNQALRLLEKQEKRLLLGLPGIQDRKVQYNPAPTEMFWNVFEEIRRTLAALLSGALNPKWMVGPVGIIQVVHDTSMTSYKEALYWLGAISLNLGVLNLLPIPVLDGGTILMSLFEMVSGRKLHPKTLERLIIPFAILLIGFFIFLTYNDLLRLFSSIMQ